MKNDKKNINSYDGSDDDSNGDGNDEGDDDSDDDGDVDDGDVDDGDVDDGDVDDGDHQVGDVLLDIGDLASKRREDCQKFEHLLFAFLSLCFKQSPF